MDAGPVRPFIEENSLSVLQLSKLENNVPDRSTGSGCRIRRRNGAVSDAFLRILVKDVNIQTSLDIAAGALQLPQPYLLFLGDATESGFAKTAYGLRDWAPEKCVGEYALPAATVSTGLPALTPAEAVARGARSILIGIANRGGVIAPDWIPALVEALEAGLDIVSGMHARLSEIPELAEPAARLGRQLIDVRHAPQGFPVGTGRKRWRASVC